MDEEYFQVYRGAGRPRCCARATIWSNGLVVAFQYQGSDMELRDSAGRWAEFQRQDCRHLAEAALSPRGDGNDSGRFDRGLLCGWDHDALAVHQVRCRFAVHSNQKSFVYRPQFDGTPETALS